MQRSTLAMIIICAVGASACLAADDYEIKVYPCPLADKPIVVDGALNEACWNQAPLVGGFTYYNKPEMVAVQTFFRILHDAKCLYFGIVCDEPLAKHLTPVPQARDAHGVFGGETIELFVDPKHNHTRYYQIAVNAAGSVYDSRRTDASWSADVVAKTKLGGDRWTMEVAIPWADLDVKPEAGTVVGFNVCRDRYLGNARVWSNWSQTNGNFHDPIRFAHLVLSPTAEQLGRLGAEFRKGGRRGAIVVFSAEGFAQTTYRALAQRSIAGVEALLTELDKARQQEADPKTRAELEKRINACRSEIAPFQQQITGQGRVDAATWTRMEHRISQITGKLQQVIWDARLSALLSRI